jgi:histone methylation protein DOT1
MEMVQYVGRAVSRLKARGLRDISRYSVHVIKEKALASAIDLRFGGKVCRNNLDETIYNNGRHTMVHSQYHVLRDIFSRVPIDESDVLVDIGCGEGRVINFWLSQGLTNPMIGIEAVEAVANQTRERYRKYENVAIVTGDALEKLPTHGTLFYLYNPFSDEIVVRFEEASRHLNAKIVFYQNNYMKPFLSDAWQVEPIVSKGTVYEFQAALITKRAA